MSESTLDRFGAGGVTEAPLFKRKAVKQSPHTGKIAGFVGKELNRDLLGYATRRRRSHYYQKGEGYAISDTILRAISNLGVTHVFVHGADANDDVLEFVTRQYTEDGQAVPTGDLEDEDDPQTYVPGDAAREVWPRHVGRLYYQPFEQAMERIGWRGYDHEKSNR